MKKIVLVIAALLTLSGVFAPRADAVAISVGINDRPYYVHGPGYWGPGHVYRVWVPGHYSWRYHHRVWVHGHYRARY